MCILHSIKADTFIWKINNKVNCESQNVVYMIECNLDRCGKRYIGQTERKLKERMSEHRGYVTNRILTEATGLHFNLPGHSIANMTITILEKVKKNDPLYRREREKYLIRKFNTFYKGLNRSPQ